MIGLDIENVVRMSKFSNYYRAIRRFFIIFRFEHVLSVCTHARGGLSRARKGEIRLETRYDAVRSPFVPPFHR